MAGEKGVLKLVHPGRFIEIHTEPIPAFEVLNKYPRHCITRPDVFEFPWIVVKPDALLIPGNVFFLVPKRTIYLLMKSSSSRQKSCFSSSFSNSPTKSLAGMTPKHQIHGGLSILRSGFRSFRKTPEKGNTPAREIEEEIETLKDTEVNKRKEIEIENEEDDGLRSCFRKPDSSRRLLNLRVTFGSDCDSFCK